MNIKGNRIISEKNVFRRIAALLTTLLLVITAIPEGFSTAITSVAEAADTAVTGAYFDTDGMEIVTYNVVNDFGADNTGNAMTGKQIQQALDAAQENSGQGIFTKVGTPAVPVFRSFIFCIPDFRTQTPTASPSTSPIGPLITRSARLSIGVTDLLIRISLCPL